MFWLTRTLARIDDRAVGRGGDRRSLRPTSLPNRLIWRGVGDMDVGDASGWRSTRPRRCAAAGPSGPRRPTAAPACSDGRCRRAAARRPGVATATVPRPRASAARAVPRRARRRMEILVILASSHRNDGDSVAASDADHRTGRHRRRPPDRAACGANWSALAGRLRDGAGRDAAALEARHVAAGE